jgi:phosphate-selective porin OprO and OprP
MSRPYAFRTAAALLLSATMLSGAPAYAQSDDAEVEALRAEVAALKAQLAALSAKVDAVANAPKPAALVAASADAAAAPAKDKKSAPEIAFKGAPEISTKDGWSFKPRGRIHYDTGYVSIPGALNNTRNLGFNSRVRRIRLGAEGNMPGGFGYKVEVDFAGAGVSFGEAFLSYSDDGLGVRIGNFDTMSGLEQISSSNNSSFIERAAFNDAFLNSRRLGAAVAWVSDDKDLRLEGGLFAAHSIDSSFDNDGWIGAARLIYAPEAMGGRLHLGLNYQYRNFAANAGGVASSGVNMPSTNQLARYRARPNSQLTDVRFIDTGSFAASSDQIIGIELAGIFDSLYFAGEAQWLKANAYAAGDVVTGLDGFSNGNVAVTPTGDPGFFGAYGELGYFLTGETRGYKHGDGTWSRTKVKNPVSSGGIGAFQIAGRLDYVDLDDPALKNGVTNNFSTGGTSLAALNTRLGRGGTQTSYMLGLNWMPIDYVRFLFNYVRADVDGGPIAISAKPLAGEPVDQRSYGVDVFAARMQIEF